MIKLMPMEALDFQAYLTRAVEDYAQEHVKAGNWTPDEALERSAKEFHELLPDGVATKDQYLFSIVDADGGQTVGMIWFAAFTDRPHPNAFIYDFRVDEAQRGKGYGKQALLAIEEKVRALGMHSIELHVFGHNHTARALYEKVGYQVTNLHMAKEIQ